MTPMPTPDDRAGERGWVLLTAMSLLTIMTIVGLATLSIVDTQTKRSREQRERESSLNMAESALYQQGFKLAQQWPSQATPAADCSSAAAAAGCPAADEVLANSSNVDTAVGASWTTIVRDNGGDLATAFQPGKQDATQVTKDAAGNVVATCTGPCRYDANGDKKLWVRSQSIVRGRKRTVVATLKLETLAESVPQTAVTAGGINTGHPGAQVKIYAVGSNVVVRCDPATTSGSGNNKKNTCVSDPAAIQPAAQQGATGNLMTPEQIARFKARAIADGTYHAGCPSGNAWNLTGAVVFVDKCYDANAKLDFNVSGADCALPPKPAGAGNGLQPDCINSLKKPGLLIWHCGGLGTSGKGTFVGVMYFVNGSDGQCGTAAPYAPKGTNPPDCSGNNNDPANVVSFTGGLGVLGALAIDGNGCLYASANGIQIQFDPNVFGAVASYGTVGLVQDTWRELIPS